MHKNIYIIQEVDFTSVSFAVNILIVLICEWESSKLPALQSTPN